MKLYKKAIPETDDPLLELLVEEENSLETENSEIKVEDDKIIITNIEPGSPAVGQVYLSVDELRKIANFYLYGEFV